MLPAQGRKGKNACNILDVLPVSIGGMWREFTSLTPLQDLLLYVSLHFKGFISG